MASETGPLIDHLPLVPDAVLRRHHINQPQDTRFRAAARLLQALWRSDRQFTCGTYTRTDGKHVRLGSRLSPAAGRAGANFLTPDIAALAQRECCYREIGALIDEERLSTNLLSSMPLTFNLVGPLRLDVDLATAVTAELLPGFDGAVTQVLFEHAPARGNMAFTGDHTAFDALIRYARPGGCRGFVALEVKYSESCTEPVGPPRPRYADLSRSSGLYRDPDGPQLRANPLQQFWREHMLAQAMVAAGMYDEGFFVLIAPRQNHAVQRAARAYACQLAAPAAGQVGFINWHLEAAIAALRTAGAGAHADALHRRYTDFWQVDGEIELALAAQRSKAERQTRKTINVPHGAAQTSCGPLDYTTAAETPTGRMPAPTSTAP